MLFFLHSINSFVFDADDLMTMLVAGHETTAAVLTWALFELTKNPDCMEKVREEIDRVVGDREPTHEDVVEMKYLRLVVAETLRLYPQPPLLIRRCRTEDKLPKGGGREATVIRGMDIFLALYNIHRDERFWEFPDVYVLLCQIFSLVEMLQIKSHFSPESFFFY